jgi:hypothetical protein
MMMMMMRMRMMRMMIYHLFIYWLTQSAYLPPRKGVFE